MMIGLREYLRHLEPESQYHPEAACYITELRVSQSGTVEAVLLLEALLSCQELIRLEELLERHFNVREVFIVQHVSMEGSPVAGGMESATTAAAYFPWLLRHVRQSDPYLFAMLSGSPVLAGKEGARILIPRGCEDPIGEPALLKLEELLYQGISMRIRFHVREGDVNLQEMAAGQALTHRGEEAAHSIPSSRDPKAVRSAGRTDENGQVMDNARYHYRKKLVRQEDGLIFGKYDRQMETRPIGELNVQSGVACFEGAIVETSEIRLVSSNTRVLLRFSVFDGTGTISCHAFLKPEVYEEAGKALNLGNCARFQARIGFDGKYSNDLDADILGACVAQPLKEREDNASEKRVELHCHTKMSARDAVSDVTDIVAAAIRWKHPAVAITDHGVVQAFPDARQTLKNSGSSETKLIFGVECYLVDDGDTMVFGMDSNPDLDPGYVAIDVETTGLDPKTDRLTEIGAVRFLKGRDGRFAPADSFSTLVNPGIPIPDEVFKLNGISNETVKDAPSPFEAIGQLRDFIGDCPVCAHNAFFDLSFLRYEGFRTPEKNGPRIKFNPVIVDTLRLSRRFFPGERNHRLDVVAKRFHVDMGSHHRAEDDARTTGTILDGFLHMLEADSLEALNILAGNSGYERLRTTKTPVYHCILLASDEVGLYHLYRLVSESHLRYFYNKSPRVPRSVLEYFRSGLIVGAACEAGEVFRSVTDVYRKSGRSLETASIQLKTFEMKRLARFYDYLEIQPLCNNGFMIGAEDGAAIEQKDLAALNRLVMELGDYAGRPVCATCDAHFLEKRDGVLRKILTAEMFSDFERQPDLYYRTTDEMLAEFSYLGDRAREVVIDNPKKIADLIQPDLQPFPEGFFPPVIENAAGDVERTTWETAHKIYGRDGKLPAAVHQRAERELRSIIDNGFATMYDIARRLVKQSNDDGYLVGSRGSVGSSFIATLCGITEVNPLGPHYICPDCHYVEFDESGRFGSGYDLPPKRCPECTAEMAREGQDIPFETFLGFHGDKTPDIDLNFSGEYQSRAHRLIEDLFGKAYTFKAGTISTYAEKNTMAMVRGFYEKTGAYSTEAEKRRLAGRLQGVRQTTGQHPGAIVVVPKDREIYDFTPVQNPADKSANGIITTHFDFNSMHDTILKLDVLGKDDPTMLRFLYETTGIDVLTVPIMDEKIMSLFTSTKALGIPDGSWDVGIGTLSIPEMGTFMARGMIRDIRPTRFYDLVQLMGLSHGKNVWVGNAQDLIRQGVCDITQVIGCRDSIMTALIQFGLSSKMSFDIMERVRKGKGLATDQEAAMKEHGVPDWYIDSCKKISYMFPKAHAVAYAITALRLAWFKVYRPVEYYCAFFTVRADEFDCSEMCGGLESVRAKRQDIARRMNTDGETSTALEDRKYYILELIEEMHLRGILFEPVDLYRSDASRFAVASDSRILPPLNAVPGISAVTASRIVEARAAGKFLSREELSMRAGLGSAIITALEGTGCLKDIPTSTQLDLFSLA